MRFIPSARILLTIPTFSSRKGSHHMEAEGAFSTRMVEQVQHIEHYRQEVLRVEGRLLDDDSAALEWITRYAATFPPIETYSSH